jgi:hypothetical protein
METICLECGSPVRQTAGGRPRIYCSNGCRQAAHRRRHSIDGLVHAGSLEAVGREHGMLPPPAPTEDQVACAILEARAIAGAFLRLGREACPSCAGAARASAKPSTRRSPATSADSRMSVAPSVRLGREAVRRSPAGRALKGARPRGGGASCKGFGANPRGGGSSLASERSQHHPAQRMLRWREARRLLSEGRVTERLGPDSLQQSGPRPAWRRRVATSGPPPRQSRPGSRA